MIHEEICTYEVAKLAKEKGFNLKCRDYYNMDSELRVNGIYTLEYTNSQIYEGYMTAPTQSLLQRWLREEKYLFIDIGMAFNGYYYQVLRTDKFDECIGTQIIEHFNGNKFETYEFALEDALKYALEHLI